MARRTIESVRTGETFIFSDDWNDAEGRVGRMECELKGHVAVPRHSHPRVAKTVEVQSGLLGLKVRRKTWFLRPGEQYRVEPGYVHAFWNESAAPVRLAQHFDPPLAIEPFYTALPRAMISRNPFKRAVFLADFRAVSRRRGVRARLFVTIFAPLGRLLGLTRWYRGSPR
jgi:hypothetical protein